MNEVFRNSFEKYAGLAKGLAVATGGGIASTYAYSKYKDRNKHTNRGPAGKYRKKGFEKKAGPELWQQSSSSENDNPSRNERQALLERYEQNSEGRSTNKGKKAVKQGPTTSSSVTRERQGRGW